MTRAGTVSVEVCHGWAVVVDDEQHGGGTMLDVPADLAARWVAAGWVRLADSVPAKAKRRRRT